MSGFDCWPGIHYNGLSVILRVLVESHCAIEGSIISTIDRYLDGHVSISMDYEPNNSSSSLYINLSLNIYICISDGISSTSWRKTTNEHETFSTNGVAQ